jgi:thiol:disulfide interchange protein
LALALVPAAARALPAPGPWLPRLREGLGFLAGGSAVWLLFTLSRQVSPEGLAFVELALLAVGLLAWLRARLQEGDRTRPASRALLAAALVACAAGALWLADHNRLVPRQEPPARSTAIASPDNPNSGG